MTSSMEQALPERTPSLTDLVAARTQARRLLLMSRGIYILMAGAFIILFVSVQMTAAINPAHVTIASGTILLLFYPVQIAVQRWRRAHGITFTMPGDLSGQQPSTAEFRRSIGVLLGLSFLGVALGFLMCWLVVRVDTQWFDYAVVAFLVAFGLNAMWFWRNTRAWETWVCGAAMIVASIVIALFGLERGAWVGLLTMGTGGAVAGISLELRWINWVRRTCNLVGEDVSGEVQS